MSLKCVAKCYSVLPDTPTNEMTQNSRFQTEGTSMWIKLFQLEMSGVESINWNNLWCIKNSSNDRNVEWLSCEPLLKMHG